MEFKIYFNKFIIVFCTVFISIVIKLFQENLFPAKYFYDSLYILFIMQNPLVVDKAYSFTATLFRHINFFGLTTLFQWRILITVVFLPIVLFLINKRKNYSNIDTLYIIATIVLLNMYVFNLSKDIIQFMFFLFISYVLSNRRLNNKKKMFLIFLILLFESVYFRVYYLLIGILMISIYYIYCSFISNKKLNKGGVIKLIIFSFILFFLEVYVLSLISFDNYNLIMNARYSVNIWRENSLDAVTIINDLLGRNNNIFVFIGNYLVNFIRFSFPIELISNGVKYVAFFAYQLLLVRYLLLSKKILSEGNVLIIAILISFFMVSVIFEPDFGSFIRHEASLFPIILLLLDKEADCYKNVGEV